MATENALGTEPVEHGDLETITLKIEEKLFIAVCKQLPVEISICFTASEAGDQLQTLQNSHSPKCGPWTDQQA